MSGCRAICRCRRPTNAPRKSRARLNANSASTPRFTWNRCTEQAPCRPSPFLVCRIGFQIRPKRRFLDAASFRRCSIPDSGGSVDPCRRKQESRGPAPCRSGAFREVLAGKPSRSSSKPCAAPIWSLPKGRATSSRCATKTCCFFLLRVKCKVISEMLNDAELASLQVIKHSGIAADSD